MGSMKEEMLRVQQGEINKKHAQRLSVDVGEYEMYLEDVDVDENNTVVFEFSKDAPQDFLDRVGADEMGRVTLSALDY